MPLKPTLTKEKPLNKAINNDSKKRKSELEKLDINIKSLEKELIEIEKLMESSASNYDELNNLYNKKQELTMQLEEILEAWLNLENDNEVNAL